MKLQYKIGHGATSYVFKGLLDSDQQVAIKRRTFDELDAETIREFARELGISLYESMRINMYSELQHPNIVKFIAASVSPPYICIMMEYCEYGSLGNVLVEKAVTPMLSLSFCIDCVRGVGYHII